MARRIMRNRGNGGGGAKGNLRRRPNSPPIIRMPSGGGRPRPNDPPRTDPFPIPGVPTTPPGHNTVPGNGPRPIADNNQYDTGWNQIGRRRRRGGQQPGGTPPIHTMPPNGWEPLPGGGNGGGRPGPDGPPTTDQAQGGRIWDDYFGQWVSKNSPRGLTIRQQQNQSDAWNEHFGPKPTGPGGTMQVGQYFNPQEWSSLSPEVLAANMATLASNPGARKYLPEDAFAQIAQIAQGAGVQAPSSFMSLLQPSGGTGGPANAVGRTPSSSGDLPLLTPGVAPGAPSTPSFTPGSAPMSSTSAPSFTTQTPTGQPQISGGPMEAGRTGVGLAAHARPFSPGAQAPAGAAAQGGGGRGVQNFLPMTPAYESGRRGAEDQLAAQLMQIGVAREQIPAYLALLEGRAGTDQTYATQALMGDLADRGVYDSTGIRNYLQTRDVGIPYGRAAQDRALDASGQYADLAAQEGNAYLSYDQQMMERLLRRAADVAAQMPLSVSQYRQNRAPRRRKGKGKGGRN